MCGILAVLGSSDDSQAKRVRVLELSRRQFHFPFFLICFSFSCVCFSFFITNFV
ncbi:hypothetical protein MKW92_043209, partial [Papaver armeniacum]